MKTYLVAFASLVSVFCELGSFAKAAEPPLRDELTYATQAEAMVTYEVTVEIGQGDGAESYQGTLVYERDAPDQPGSWKASGSLSAVPPSPNGAAQLALTRRSVLNAVEMPTSHFEMDVYGRITAASEEKQLKLLLGDFAQWGIAPLPAAGETKWQVTEPTIVRQFAGKLPLGNFPLSLRRSGLSTERLSAGMETVSYKITGTEGPITIIEHSYQLKADFADPPLTMTGKGTGRFDRRRGVFDQLQWTRQIVSIRDGAEIRMPVRVTLQRTHDDGLVPLTEEEKAAKKKREEEARRRAAKNMAEMKRRMEEHKKERERQAAAPFDSKERETWIAALNAGTEYGDGAQIYGKLHSRSPRHDPELAKALYEFANRITPSSLATMFWNLAANFDPDFKAVLELRKAYGNSHTNLPDVGKPVPQTSKLKAGQLVAVKQKHRDSYRAKLVVTQKTAGQLLVRSIDSNIIEQVAMEDVRAPADEVMPYLPEPQRFGSAKNAAGGMDGDGGGPSASKVRTWTDRSGQYSIQGRFVSLRDETVRLEKSDGTTVDVALDKLQEADAKIARELAAAENNPFRIVSP